MGNSLCSGGKDEDWKQQNKQMVENPAFKFVNLAKGGTLIDAYSHDGPQKVDEIARNEMSSFFYDRDGRGHLITEAEFIKWRWKFSQRVAGLDGAEKAQEEELKAENAEDYFNKFIPHEACWDLDKRGGVGETPFHLLILMDSPVHFEVARILLKIYPNLALDIYEGEEYYGESSLHIAIVIGDFELVQLLVEAGANVNQRATGRFFLPEDQKKAHTGQTNYEGYAYYGEYPLAFAACLGNTDIYDFLLDHGANPNLQDSFGNTVLHMVVIANQSDMYKYAVRHHKLPASTNIKNNQNLTPLTLACKLGRHIIFKEMLDIDSIEFWRFSTTMCSAHPLRTLDSIGPDGSTNWNSALMIIVNGEKDDHLEMLEGGVMRQLLIEKWKTFAKSRFMIRLVLAIIHLALFSVSIYTRPMGLDLLGYRGCIDAVRYTSEITVCLSCLSTVFYEITEISTQGLSSFFKNCTHAPAQTVYLISCLLVLVCIPFRLTGMHDAEDVLLILAAPCVWFFLLFFARGYVLTGPFVTMIYKMIAGDLFRFGIIYVIFLSGFTQAFYFLFQEAASDTLNQDLAKFATLPETILNLFQMTLGEFKYDAFSDAHYASLTKIIFAFFMILVPILLLNMLIAMMGNTYTQVISKSTKEWWKQWAKIVVVMERGISRKNLLKFQQAYSVRLAGAARPDHASPPIPEERALVVIRSCSKSKAKTRKDAVFRWKTLGKEVIRQLRKRKQGEPFELEESLKKGQLLNEDSQALLSSTVAQLAWEKDIDLTKGHLFVADPSGCSSQSSSPHALGEGQMLSYLPNGFVVKANKQEPDSATEHESNDVRISLVRRRKRLVSNRVNPFSVSVNAKEETAFFDRLRDSQFHVSQHVTASQDLYFSSVVSQTENPVSALPPPKLDSSTKIVTEQHDLQHETQYDPQYEPRQKNVHSELSALSDTYTVNKNKQDKRRHSPQSKQQFHQLQMKSLEQFDVPCVETDIITSLSHDIIAYKTPGYNRCEVGDTESSITASSETTSAAFCWTEANPNVKVTQKRRKRKGKKSNHKGRKKWHKGTGGSSSSLVTLIESASSARGTTV